MDISPKDLNMKAPNSQNSTFIQLNQTMSEDIVSFCPSNIDCEKLTFPCIKCNLTNQCTYGEHLNVTCTVHTQVHCNVSINYIF